MCIQNSTAYTLSVAAQQSVRNAMANVGLDEVVVKFAYSNDDDPVFDLHDTEGNYQFSIDTSDNTIFDKN